MALIETWKYFLVLSPRSSWIYGKRQIHRNQIPSLLPLAHLVECKIGEKRECFMRESTTTADQMLNLKYSCIQNQILLDILQLRNIRKAPKRQACKPQPNKCPSVQEATLLADCFLLVIKQNNPRPQKWEIQKAFSHSTFWQSKCKFCNVNDIQSFTEVNSLLTIIWGVFLSPKC